MDYYTLKTEAQTEFTEKKSRFIGCARPVSTQREAKDFIERISKEHWDARHNVFAYRLREGGARYSDGGEPAGTAGLPVLSVLEKSGITDGCVVVTRYFGGVLLGASGLIRAYSHAASLAVGAAGVAHMRLCAECTLTCDYGDYGRASAVLPEKSAVVDDVIYADVVSIKFHIPIDLADDITRALADATNGRIIPAVTGKGYYVVTS